MPSPVPAPSVPRIPMNERPDRPTPGHLAHLLGLTYEAACGSLRALGQSYRIARRNGFYLVLTRDYDPQRVNLCLRDSVVVAAYLD